jgi:acyl transferase domain-containing protein
MFCVTISLTESEGFEENVNGIELFDRKFFGITADEAKAMDPQQR